jgi:hypothetical protein
MKKTCLCLLLAATLAACGGGGGDGDEDQGPLPIVDVSTAVAGDAAVGSMVLVLPLPGPVLQLEQPARVRVRLAGQVDIGAHYVAHATVATALAAPLATVPAHVVPNAPARVPLSYEVWLQLPAGTHALQARIALRATDGNGLPTGALGRASASVEWRVEPESVVTGQ